MQNRTEEEETLYQHYFQAIEQVLLSPKPILTELTSHSDTSHKITAHDFERRQGQDVLVLDSSFNPPHAAHALLLQRSLSHFLSRQQPVLGPSRTAIKAVLLFATTNADKCVSATSVSALVAAYADRAMLMRKFLDQQPQSKHHQTSSSVECNVELAMAVCNCSKFVDKARLFSTRSSNSNSIGITGITPSNLVFAVGFDTIERVFAPRYYLDVPGGIASALGQAPFRFLIMTRDASSYPGPHNTNTAQQQQQQRIPHENEDGSLAEQKKQLQSHLSDLGLWDYWQHRLEWISGDASSFGVSSSRIRQLVGLLNTSDSINTKDSENITSNKQLLDQMCGPLVYDYILRTGLYGLKN